ncbi:MAG: hypothetical protein LC676_08395 [Loktanella sp.]|nr:hypothetical protein [Loktanella sp.]
MNELNEQLHAGEAEPDFLLVSECGRFTMQKRGQGLATEYVVCEIDPDGELVGLWVCDTQAGFYHPQAVWQFPYTQAPESEAIQPSDGWMLLAHSAKGFMRLIASQAPLEPGRAPLARVQRWDGQAWETYVEADLVSLARLVDLTNREGWLGAFFGPIQPEQIDLMGRAQ